MYWSSATHLNDKCSIQHRFVSSLMRLAIQQYKIEVFTSVARWPKWLRQAQEPSLADACGLGGVTKQGRTRHVGMRHESRRISSRHTLGLAIRALGLLRCCCVRLHLGAVRESM